MQVSVYNQENKEVGKIELPESIFSVPWNPDLVYQYLTVQLANRRKPIAHTKERGEVSGGGRKPWRQKGTGRARHGSIRSPIWVGGGITFGPRKEKDYSRKINKKMKRKALFSFLSKKLADGEVKIIESFELPEGKTKEAKSLIDKVLDKGKSALFVTDSQNKKFALAVRNIPKVSAISALSLNAYDILAHKMLFFDKKSLEEAVNHYKNI